MAASHELQRLLTERDVDSEWETDVEAAPAELEGGRRLPVRLGLLALGAAALVVVLAQARSGPAAPASARAAGDADEAIDAFWRGPKTAPTAAPDVELAQASPELRPSAPLLDQLFPAQKPEPAPPAPPAAQPGVLRWASLLRKPVRPSGQLSPAETARRSAALAKAKDEYSVKSAKAFAALAKLSYCGALPGLYAAAASTCSPVGLPGVTSPCEAAEPGFAVEPGSVRMINGEDLDVDGAYFAYLAKVVPFAEGSAFAPGVLISFRGSVDNNVNSRRDKQTMLSSVKGCDGCQVHKGYHSAYHAVEAELWRLLDELLCSSGACTVYLTGHGSGAALATITMWELARNNFTIGTSYLFESPQVSNDEMARNLNERFAGSDDHGTVFHVTNGKDALPRWPFNDTFKSWGVESHFPGKTDVPDALCWAGDAGCGVAAVPASELSETDACAHPLAPEQDFCALPAFAEQCYGGMGYDILKQYPEEALTHAEQPIDQAPAKWYPAAASGKQAAAESSDHVASDYYSLEVLKAMAALSKAAYCGPTAGVASTVQRTCRGSEGVCQKAGFGIVPNSVHSVSAVQDSIFFYTALARRTSTKFAGKPFFIPAEFCLLVFRGTANQANSIMNRKVFQVPLGDGHCSNCTVNEGLAEVWIALEAQIEQALKQSGCELTPKTNNEWDPSDKVVITGHSMGGTMATLAAYMLHRRGFDVQLSWSIEGGRPGNAALMEYIMDHMITSRPVPIWSTAYSLDGVPRTPKSIYNGGQDGRQRFRVYFPDRKAEHVKLCTEEFSIEDKCGLGNFSRQDLTFGVPSNVHCGLPFAPDGNICMIPGYVWPSPYAVSMQCSIGGAL